MHFRRRLFNGSATFSSCRPIYCQRAESHILAYNEQCRGIVNTIWTNSSLTIKFNNMEKLHDKKDRVIALLITFNQMTQKVLRLKTKNRQALGLLAEAMQINKQMLSLVKDNKISLEFVRQIFAVISVLAKEIISKWLFRYNLAPVMA